MLLRFFESKRCGEWCSKFKSGCRRCFRCIKRCLNCLWRWSCCRPCFAVCSACVSCVTCGGCTCGGDCVGRVCACYVLTQPSFAGKVSDRLRACFRKMEIRWYWFLIVGQVGFMVREFIVICRHNGWGKKEVFVSHISIWAVIGLTVRQVWLFSYVRNKSHTAVDQVLDILLLPMNYGLLCALSVRLLAFETPENKEQRGMMALALIDSADIWESWALWSVLKLFVRIVDSESVKDVHRDAAALENGALPNGDIKVRNRSGSQDDAECMEPAASIAPSKRLSSPVSTSQPRLTPTSPCTLLLPNTGDSSEADAAAAATDYVSNVLGPRCVERIMARCQAEQPRAPLTPVAANNVDQAQSEKDPLVRSSSCATFQNQHPELLLELDHDPNQDITPRVNQAKEPSPAPSVGDRRPKPFQRQQSWLGSFDRSDQASKWTSECSGGHAVAQRAKNPTGDRYLEVVKAIKMLSLMGVKAWVWLLFFVCLFEMTLKGIVAVRSPTLCYMLTNSCMSCNDWYSGDIYPVTMSVLYILCCLALIMVVTFERAFKDYLHKIEPYWKFWGVKIVVSVTYFQSTLISHFFGLTEPDISKFNSLLCCVELPLLCVLHAKCAYPLGDVDAPCEWVCALLGADGKYEAHTGQGRPRSLSDQDACLKIRGVFRMLLYALVFMSSCWASVKFVLWMLPVDMESESNEPFYKFTCTEDLYTHVATNTSKLHWILPQSTLDALSRPPSGGLWLPYCTNAHLACQPGFAGSPGVFCSPNGTLVNWGAPENACREVGCGAPLEQPFARVDEDPNGPQTWTEGMVVHYTCDTGFRGAPEMQCGTDGHWKPSPASRPCEMIGCGALKWFLLSRVGQSWRDVMSIDEGANPNESYDGEVVHFRCAHGYRGNPLARCVKGHNNSGSWTLTDKCGPFKTVSGCSCKKAWALCIGWFGSDCEEVYGCASDTSAPSSWCKVEGGSCPSSARNFGIDPPWDYCVDDNFNITWTPKPIPNRYFSRDGELYQAAVFLTTMGFSFLCFLWLVHLAYTALLGLAPHLRHGVKGFKHLLQRIPGLKRRWSRIVLWECQQAFNRGVAMYRDARLQLDAASARCAAATRAGLDRFRDRVAELTLRFQDSWTSLSASLRSLSGHLADRAGIAAPPSVSRAEGGPAPAWGHSASSSSRIGSPGPATRDLLAEAGTPVPGARLGPTCLAAEPPPLSQAAAASSQWPLGRDADAQGRSTASGGRRQTWSWRFTGASSDGSHGLASGTTARSLNEPLLASAGTRSEPTAALQPAAFTGPDAGGGPPPTLQRGLRRHWTRW